MVPLRSWRCPKPPAFGAPGSGLCQASPATEAQTFLKSTCICICMPVLPFSVFLWGYSPCGTLSDLLTQRGLEQKGGRSIQIKSKLKNVQRAKAHCWKSISLWFIVLWPMIVCCAIEVITKSISFLGLLRDAHTTTENLSFRLSWINPTWPVAHVWLKGLLYCCPAGSSEGKAGTRGVTRILEPTMGGKEGGKKSKVWEVSPLLDASAQPQARPCRKSL